MLVEGKQQWLFDEIGRRYLDVSDSMRIAVPDHASSRCQTPAMVCSSDVCATSLPCGLWHDMQRCPKAEDVFVMPDVLGLLRSTPRVGVTIGFRGHRDRQRGPLPPGGGPRRRRAEPAAAAHDDHLPQRTDRDVRQGAHGPAAGRPEGPRSTRPSRRHKPVTLIVPGLLSRLPSPRQTTTLFSNR